MKPKHIALLVALLFVGGGILLSLRGGQAANENVVSISPPQGVSKKLSQDINVPDFYVTKGNQTYTLADFKGRYIFINFWNTWCPPCKEEMPDLNRLYSDYRDKNVEFLFINITPQEKTEQAIVDFLKENNLTLPVYLDREAEVAMTYGVRSIPTTVVVNSNGEVVYASPGILTFEKAKQLLE